MKRKTTALEREADRLDSLLESTTQGSEEYYSLLATREKLQDILDKAEKAKFKVSGDTLVTGGVSLLSILAVLKHEQLNVISTKALGFIMKLKP